MSDEVSSGSHIGTGISSSIAIWDYPDPPPDTAVIVWNHINGHLSMLQFAEDHRVLLGRTLLEWFASIQVFLASNNDSAMRDQSSSLHQVSCSVVNRRNPWFIERFSVLVRLSALEVIIRQTRISSVSYEGSNRETAALIAECCRSHGVDFTSSISVEHSQRVPVSDKAKKLLRQSPALRLFVFVLRRRGLSSLRPKELSESQVLFVSPMAHLNPQNMKHVRYQSGYWQNLPVAIEQRGQSVLMLYWISQNSIRHPKQLPAMVLATPNSILLDSFLDLRSIGRALRSWLRNRRHLRKRVKLLVRRPPEGCPQFVVTHLKRELERTVYGDLALEYSLQREMIRSFAQNLTQVNHAVIASENFPIECDLHDALGRKTAGNFILFAHGGVRPWDLKYARFPNNSEVPHAALASVDRGVLLAINGEIDRLSLEEMGDDLGHVVDVEALRFLGLANLRVREKVIEDQTITSPLHLLVLGDYMLSPTLELCKLVKEVLPTLGVGTSLTFRPHPLTVARDKDALGKSARSSSGTLAEDLSSADVVISTASSSSGLGAVLAGKSVVVVVSASDLNYSPRVPGVRFVRDGRQLADALLNGRAQPPTDDDTGLHLDPGLTRWLRLLNS